jgi:hypothetical protein
MTEKKMKSFYGRWHTVCERVARIDGFDAARGVWYGDLENFGPTLWDYKGKHLLNDQYDLYEPIPEKKEDK